MAEYIERKDLLKVLPPKCNAGDIYALAYNTCLNTIENLIKESPAADVVPVVRCKKCTHYKNGWCEILKAESPIEDGFCCYGERKVENG